MVAGIFSRASAVPKRVTKTKKHDNALRWSRRWRVLLVSASCVWLSCFHPARCESTSLVQKCQNAPIKRTLSVALAEEAKSDQAAAKLPNDYRRSKTMFSGWDKIPHDVQIVSGPTTVRVGLFRMAVYRILPSLEANELGAYQVDSSLPVDCIVSTADGHLWAVTHMLDRTKAYLNTDDLVPLNLSK